MEIDVQFEDDFADALDEDVIAKAAGMVLADHPEIASPSLTVLVTGDNDIRALNLEYMGMDAPTDVLSFPSGELDGSLAEETYLGDIMISLETAARQAEQGGHTLVQEIELLTVHGVLHLLGHDHGDEVEKAAMWDVQARVLKKLANPLSPP